MREMKFFALITVSVIFLLMALPASAVIMEETYKGQVSKLEPSKKSLTMQVSSVYEGGQWVTFAKSSLKSNIVVGTTYNPDIFNDLKQGDPIEATILGGPGGEWISVGKIGTVGSTQSPLIASYGDPSRLISYFYQGYTVKTELKPDCSWCEGTTCTASSAIVSPIRDNMVVETKEMYPGYTHVFGWNSEYQYILKIKFNSGRASSDLCPGTGVMAGPQAVSDFTIYDTQRSTILASEVDIAPSETEITTLLPTETEILHATPEMTSATQAPVPQPTQSGFGMELFIAAGLFGCIMVLLRKN
ncbi:MAG: hypothetical protein JXQ82_05935 [Methanomicrobiaceae archaeon]|nr:hypothetical protein [Methanomicrobiaceae archaeon]